MNLELLLSEALKICSVHADRLKLGLRKTAHLFPFTHHTIMNISDDDFVYVELLISRLGKLQDTLGEKVFTLILTLLGETVTNKSFIDKLNKLEKLEILPSAQWWQELRQLRNILTHEYPDNPLFIAENLNKAIVQAAALLYFWENLQLYVNSMNFKNPLNPNENSL